MDEAFWTDRQRNSSPNDHRTPYERDYARVIHSAAFRRLQSKTQVLGMGDSDFHRTRLTHSMEVSQIGVSITKKLYRELDEDNLRRTILPPPMLMRTICTAHDLGHPPFGHGGEVALNRCMLPYGGFEGNGQTLRILTRLEPYHEGHGMNLTRRAILGVIKYPAPYRVVVDWRVYPEGEPEQPAKGEPIRTPASSVFAAADYKPPKCYLDSEHEDVVIGWVAAGLQDWEKVQVVPPSSNPKKHPKTVHKSLDTSIMELADDIAYGVHDLEDAIGLKLITPEDFREWFETADKGEPPRCQYLQPFLELHHRDGGFDDFEDQLFRQETKARKEVIGHLVGFFITRVRLEEDRTHGFTDPIFGYRARFDEKIGNALDVLKKVVVDLVIKSTPVQQLEFKGQKIVTELFDAFATDAKRLLDERTYAKSVDGGGDTPLPRVICDYIAGMTDEYATKQYQRLFAPRVGSVFDRL